MPSKGLTRRRLLELGIAAGAAVTVIPEDALGKLARGTANHGLRAHPLGTTLERTILTTGTGTGTGSAEQLAALSRELAANDWQNRVSGLDADGHDGRRGAVSDRNVELLVHAPFSFPVTVAKLDSPTLTTRRASISRALARA
jgi:hypothetical protein